MHNWYHLHFKPMHIFGGIQLGPAFPSSGHSIPSRAIGPHTSVICGQSRQAYSREFVSCTELSIIVLTLSDVNQQHWSRIIAPVSSESKVHEVDLSQVGSSMQRWPMNFTLEERIEVTQVVSNQGDIITLFVTSKHRL